MLQLGEKIRLLSKGKNISQEVFAGYLGVSFQAVSKWENGVTMPDVAMIPAIASFFGVSTDELFDFNLYENEKQVRAICDEAYKYRFSDTGRSETILREGARRFPGNEIVLNNLLVVLDIQGKTDEVIDLCRSLMESAQDHSVKYDACRILAENYKKTGKTDLIPSVLENIPEIYFTKLEVAAELLENDAGYEAAQKQKNISAESLVDMLIITGKRLLEKGETEKARSQFSIALKVIEAFKEDFVEDRWFWGTVYEYLSDERNELKSFVQ